VGIVWQGYSGKGADRISALETRQKEMELTVSVMAGQVTEVLTSTAANAQAMEDMKAMFSKYLMNIDRNDEGSPSVTVTATETRGDTRPSRIQHTSSPSVVLDISSESAAEEDGVANEATAKPGKEEAAKVNTGKGSAGSTKGAEGNASGRASLKKGPAMADSKDHSLPGGTGTVGVKGAPSKEVVAPKEPDGATFRRTPRTMGAEGPVVKSGAPVAKPVMEASTEGPPTKGPVEAILKNGKALEEIERNTTKEERNAGDCKKKGGTTRRPVEDDVYSFEAGPGAEVADSRTAVVRAPAMHTVQASPKKSKKQPGKVDAVPTEECASIQVRNIESYAIPGSPVITGSSKLLVFNVHGTLMDCSLVDEKNPNTKIKASAYAAGRRIIWRPWMAEFLNQCILSFKVAFWSSKSARYMQDVVPVVLGRLKGKDDCIPCFVWSTQECEPVQLGDGSAMEGGKPLDAVYRRWPCWNASNTVIVDHNFSRVACNPMSNIIAPNPFYVEHLQKLGEDKNYLKSTLWPMLQAFFDADDVYDFRRQFPPTAPVSDNTE
jgi:hypothetical protein